MRCTFPLTVLLQYHGRSAVAQRFQDIQLGESVALRMSSHVCMLSETVATPDLTIYHLAALVYPAHTLFQSAHTRVDLCLVEAEAEADVISTGAYSSRACFCDRSSRCSFAIIDGRRAAWGGFKLSPAACEASGDRRGPGRAVIQSLSMRSKADRPS